MGIGLRALLYTWACCPTPRGLWVSWQHVFVSDVYVCEAHLFNVVYTILNLSGDAQYVFLSLSALCGCWLSIWLTLLTAWWCQQNGEKGELLWLTSKGVILTCHYHGFKTCFKKHYQKQNITKIILNVLHFYYGKYPFNTNAALSGSVVFVFCSHPPELEGIKNTLWWVCVGERAFRNREPCHRPHWLWWCVWSTC